MSSLKDDLMISSNWKMFDNFLKNFFEMEEEFIENNNLNYPKKKLVVV